MKRVVLVGLGVLGVLAAAGAQARVALDVAPQVGMEPGEAPPPTVVDEIGQWVEHVGEELQGETQVPQNADRNIRAALEAIKWAEGTAREPDPYRVCYGYRHRVVSFADHPAVTGEWRGEELPSSMGFPPGTVSTAAGAFQIRRATWLEARQALGLPDFTPASQDAAAVFLLKRRGALSLIEAGRFLEGMERARKEWASLPGAGYTGQAERTSEDLQARYVQAGGALA